MKPATPYLLDVNPRIQPRLSRLEELANNLWYSWDKACECGEILRGAKAPQDCAIFGTVCTPENPIGACAAHYTYGRFKDIPVVATVSELPT